MSKKTQFSITWNPDIDDINEDWLVDETELLLFDYYPTFSGRIAVRTLEEDDE